MCLLDSAVHDSQLSLHLFYLLEAVILEFVVLIDCLGKLLLEGLVFRNLLLEGIDLECSEELLCFTLLLDAILNLFLVVT